MRALRLRSEQYQWVLICLRWKRQHERGAAQLPCCLMFDAHRFARRFSSSISSGIDLARIARHRLRNRRPICRNARVWGVAEAEPGKKPAVVTAKLSGHRDPGYWETARMLLESALCLVLQVTPC